MSSLNVTMLEIAQMVRHWLQMPTNGYLGQSYGHDIPSLLQQPGSSVLADSLLKKLLTDVPILKRLPSGSINLYLEQVSKQHQRLIIDLMGTQVTIDSAGAIT
ncbi:hypothetical protein [Pseudomonas oryzihabitans]|uniref:hypothetical protein n=1 Tax=Pseudomonas oryzihabitans TaxID=47885 RepID=UPI0028ABF4AA|nr:hypothetical protein [Pseudomonas oryzihabitans]